MNAISKTRWSVVLDAGKGTTEVTSRALEQLCQSYWYSIYGLARAMGSSPEDAADETQEFCAYMLRGVAATADPAKGHFRGWLKASFKQFHIQKWRYYAARKRGGSASVLSFDAMEAEQRYSLEPHDRLSPDVLFDRNWFIATMEAALRRLEKEFAADGKAGIFEVLKDHLQRRENDTSYAEVATALGTTEPAVKMQISRMRKRYHELFKAELRETLADPGQADEELQHLRLAMNEA